MFTVEPVRKALQVIPGGSVEGSVRGGISDGKDATDNIVTIGGGSVKGEIYGGESVRGAAAGNTVTISGGFVEGEVCGGWTYRGNATNNTVTISGKPNMAKTYIKGGQPVNESVDTITGNILNFKSSGVSVKGVGNFERYNFYLPASTVVGGTMLGVTGAVDLKGTTVQIFLQDGCKLSKGNKIALIHSAAGVSDSPKNKSFEVKHDGAVYEFSIYTNRNNLWAKVTKVSPAAK